jgi:hypothetical protein
MHRSIYWCLHRTRGESQTSQQARRVKRGKQRYRHRDQKQPNSALLRELQPSITISSTTEPKHGEEYDPRVVVCHHHASIALLHACRIDSAQAACLMPMLVLTLLLCHLTIMSCKETMSAMCHDTCVSMLLLHVQQTHAQDCLR